jgi:hypothetical protein
MSTITAQGAKRCSHCRKTKPLDAFAYIPSRKTLASWCKVCVRVGNSEYRRTEKYRAYIAAYLVRPDVKERHRESSERRRRRGYKTPPDCTARHRVLACRRYARCELKRAATPERRAALEAMIAGYDRELARMDGES